jgi:excisionase family DNA binding protein
MTDHPVALDDVLSLEEAAQYLRIKRRTLYVLAGRGAVPGAKIGGQWRFRRSHLDALFEEVQRPPGVHLLPQQAPSRMEGPRRKRAPAS